MQTQADAASTAAAQQAQLANMQEQRDQVLSCVSMSDAPE